MHRYKLILPFAAVFLVASCDASRDSVAEDAVGEDAVEEDAVGEDAVALDANRCSLHAECESDLCDTYLPTGSGPGSCIDESQVIYVDLGSCGGPGVGDGTRDAPVCFVQEAIELVDDVRQFVRLSPGRYQSAGISGKRVGIYGPDPDEGTAEVGEEDTTAVRVGDGAHVVLDRLVVGRSGFAAVNCSAGPSGASVEVRRSDVRSNNVTFIASGCDVRLDRNVITGINGGLVLNAGTYEVTNNVVHRISERIAVVLNGGSGRFLLNTVTANGELGLSPTIQCRTPALLEDSIVAGNVGRAGSQFEGACSLRRVVVGSSDSFASPGAIRLDPELNGFELPRTEANLACCIDRAPRRPRLRRDVVGTSRPQGAAFDIGAYEAPAP